MLAKNQTKDLNAVIKENRFKTGTDLKYDEQKHRKDALDTSLTMQEQLLLDLTYQNEIAHEKSLECQSVSSVNQTKVEMKYSF